MPMLIPFLRTQPRVIPIAHTTKAWNKSKMPLLIPFLRTPTPYEHKITLQHFGHSEHSTPSLQVLIPHFECFFKEIVLSVIKIHLKH